MPPARVEVTKTLNMGVGNRLLFNRISKQWPAAAFYITASKSVLLAQGLARTFSHGALMAIFGDS